MLHSEQMRLFVPFLANCVGETVWSPAKIVQSYWLARNIYRSKRFRATSSRYGKFNKNNYHKTFDKMKSFDTVFMFASMMKLNLFCTVYFLNLLFSRNNFHLFLFYLNFSFYLTSSVPLLCDIFSKTLRCLSNDKCMINHFQGKWLWIIFSPHNFVFFVWSLIRPHKNCSLPHSVQTSINYLGKLDGSV